MTCIMCVRPECVREELCRIVVLQMLLAFGVVITVSGVMLALSVYVRNAQTLQGTMNSSKQDDDDDDDDVCVLSLIHI